MSNIELLRILSMAFVVVVHFVGAAFGLPEPAELRHPTAAMLGKTAAESLAIVGVNCFVLITGYFGLRLTWRKVAGYTFTCLFASLVVYVFAGIRESNLTAAGLWEAVRVYSVTDLWFVRSYLALMLLSPVLESGLRALDNRRLGALYAGLLFLNVYLGWLCGTNINPYGYNEMQMLLLYTTGHLLARHADRLIGLGRRCLRGHAAGFYFMLYIAAGCCVMACAFFIEPRRAYAYNSPFVLAESVALFLAFVALKPFRSEAVNAVASSVFMVYLLHKTPGVWRMLRGMLYEYSLLPCPVFFAMSALLMIMVFALSILADKMRLVSWIWLCNLCHARWLQDKVR